MLCGDGSIGIISIKGSHATILIDRIHFHEIKPHGEVIHIVPAEEEIIDFQLLADTYLSL